MELVSLFFNLPFARLIALELRSVFRKEEFRLIAILCGLVGWFTAPQGGSAGLSAYNTGEIACRYLVVAASSWMAYMAVRDELLGTDVLIYSKPQLGERLAIARFAAGYVAATVVVAAFFFGAAAYCWKAQGGIVGLPAFAYQFGRSAAALFTVAATAFALALLSHSQSAGYLAGAYWLLVLAGEELLPKVILPWYTQNLPAFSCLAAGVMLFASLTYSYRWRGASRRPVVLMLVASLFLISTVFLFRKIAREGHDPLTPGNDLLMRIARQGLEKGVSGSFEIGDRAPWFTLPDRFGRQVSTADFPQSILLLAFWSPSDPSTPKILAELQELHSRYGSKGLLPISICLSADYGAPTTFALGQSYSFPMVHDFGTRASPNNVHRSPLSTAFALEALPVIIVTNRHQNARKRIDGFLFDHRRELDRAVAERLAQEPE